MIFIASGTPDDVSHLISDDGTDGNPGTVNISQTVDGYGSAHTNGDGLAIPSGDGTLPHQDVNNSPSVAFSKSPGSSAVGLSSSSRSVDPGRGEEVEIKGTSLS